MGVTVREKDKGSGVWWVFINHDGRRKAKKVGSKRAARQVAEKLEEKLAGKEFNLNEASAPLFKELAEAWLEITVPATCKPSTCKDYEVILRLHVGPVFNQRPVDKITRLEVKDFLLGKVRDGYAPSSVTHFKNAISGVLNRAVEAGILEHNPAKTLGRLYREKPRGEEISPFSYEELERLLGTLSRHWPRYYPLVLCLARTGMRFGEAAALTWEDVDFQARAIHVRRGLSRMEVETPKSGKTRVVDMSLQLTETLRELKTSQKREALAKGMNTPPTLVFPNQAGRHLDIYNWRSRIWKKALQKAELPHRRIHDLRHTYASLRISKGDNLADVSKQLGHYSVKFTLDQYYHWVPGEAKGEVDGLDNMRPAATYVQPANMKGASLEG